MHRLIVGCSALAAVVAAGCQEGTFYTSDGNGLPFPGSDLGGLKTPTCPGEESTVSGTVLAPNGVDPVPGATVFIPAEVPEIFPPSVACEVCGHLGSANNLWTATTGADGKFTLQAVCPGTWLLVMQNGRFRRAVDVTVGAPTTVNLPPDQTRLPKRDQEFRLEDAVPKIAVATGDYDKMECVLRKMGLADGTFDLYEAAVIRPSPPSPMIKDTFAALVTNPKLMKTYNVIFINCTANTFEAELNRTEVRQNISDYVKSGGRLYVTDWSYDWIEQVETFSPFIDFEPGASPAAPEGANMAAIGQGGLQVSALVKDPQLAEWLTNFPGAIENNHSHVEHFLPEWVIMYGMAEDVKLWVEGEVRSLDGSINGVKPLTVTFNFENCGKVLYTSYHTEGRELDLALKFPNYCNAKFSPQDRILEYLIFDIASCIQPIE